MLFRAIAVSLSAFGVEPAVANCDSFGTHTPPPVTVISPWVEDLPFGKFKWGTEAYRDGGVWWVNNMILNAPDGVPLAVT
jgi:hypothetical protein